MTSIRTAFVALLLALTPLLAACGGGSKGVPSGSIAVVDGTKISRSELDDWLEQAKKSYEAQKQQFPKVGTTEYQSIQTQYVAFLVQREEFRQQADDLGITVTEKDVDKGVSDYIKEKFNGKRADLEKALKAQDFPEEKFRETIRLSVLGQKLYDAVTKDVTVPASDLLAYYNENISSYQTPASREVRHILIAEKDSKGQVDYPKSKVEADDIYSQLENGADFASLAKAKSADTGTASQGGKYTALKGQTVPEFDKKVFELKTGEISKPVKTQYGYHVIQAIGPIKPAKTRSFSEVKAAIRASLLQQRKQQKMADWVENLNKKYKSKISYATGFAPPDVPDVTDTSTETATQ